MFMKNEKKKRHTIMTVGIAVMAVYGAYSMVHCVKEMCVDKGKMLTKVFKKKENEQKCPVECGCESDSDY